LRWLGGINDAGAAAADVGIHGNRTDVAIRARGITLGRRPDGNRQSDPSSRRNAKYPAKFIFAFLYTLEGPRREALPFFDPSSPMIAGAAMSFSSVSVIVNALRGSKMVINDSEAREENQP
jgi:Cu+-exporting ATPase